MFSIVCIVLLSLNIIHGHKYITRFDEDLLKNLEISSTSIESYDEFELFERFQCAVECFKDKNTCNGYSFDSTTNLCSLFNDPTRTIDHRLTELRKQSRIGNCDKIQCKSNAVCIGEDQPTCVCLNGQPTSEECDRIEIIGIWSEYSDWSSCSVTCGEGYRFRKRDCLSSTDRTQNISTEHCIGKHVDIEPCSVKTCPMYGPWTSWTPCSTFCGIGVKQRNRSCIPPGSNCGNYTFEQRACGEANCQRVVGIKETESNKYPLKGYLAIREGDILCVTKNSTKTIHHMANLVCKSIGLSRGAQYAILNPIRRGSTCYPGIICDGTEKTLTNCKYDRELASTKPEDLYAIITRCIVDGGFSHWSSWSNCSKPCGSGEQTRSRTCTQPSPSILEPETAATNASLAGMNCTGDYIQTKSCNQQRKCS